MYLLCGQLRPKMGLTQWCKKFKQWFEVTRFGKVSIQGSIKKLSSLKLKCTLTENCHRRIFKSSAFQQKVTSINKVDVLKSYIIQLIEMLGHFD